MKLLFYCTATKKTAIMPTPLSANDLTKSYQYSMGPGLRLAQNHCLTTIAKFNKEFQVTYQLFLNSTDNLYWQNIMHLTPSNCGQRYGDRIASSWVLDGMLHIRSSVNGIINHQSNKSGVYILAKI